MFTVFGKITHPDGEPAAGLTVRAYDRDLRSQQLLGEVTTDETGGYEIVYSRDQFRRAEKKRADLVVRVFNNVGTELDVASERDGIIFNADREERVDLQVVSETLIDPSEYERLVAALRPLLEGVPLSALTEADIDFLANDTGREKNRIRFLAQDARLSQEHDLPRAVFYGFVRRDIGLVEAESGPQLDLAALLNHNNDTLRANLDAAISDHVIPISLRESLDEIIARLDSLRAEQQEQERAEWPQHQVTGRLLKAATDEPLSGYAVRAADLAAQPEPRHLGRDLTDEEGRFTFSYRTPPEASEAPRTFELTVLSQAGEEIDTREIEIRPDRSEELELAITLPEPPIPGDDMPIQALSLELSDDLNNLLEERGLKTLADVRSLGGLENLAGFTGDESAQKLQAHANLSILPSDGQTRSTLIEKGYLSPLDIASMPREAFIRSFEELPEARQLHQAAQGVDRTVSNLTTAIRANWANNLPANLLGEAGDLILPGELGDVIIPDEIPILCHCRDCESAVSPAAYLADLTRYVTNHVQQNGQLLTLNDLEGLFHQPFGDLPVSCKTTQEEVHQVRICIEVLLRHLGEDRIQFLIDPNSKGGEYREQAYELLLGQIGTTRQELRLVHAAAGDEARQSLADRLGIAVGHLDQLIFDPSSAPGTLSGLSPLEEGDLERVFGLRALTYYSALLIDPGLKIPDDPLRDLDQPKLLGWQIEHLREQWTMQDHPRDAYRAQKLPIIDPDLIGPDDFRTPDAGQSKAFKIWETRRNWVDERLKELRSKTNNVTVDGDTVTVPDTAAMFREIMTKEVTYQHSDGTTETKKKPWASSAPRPESFVDLLRRLEAGTDAENVKKTVETDLHLTVESFTRLAQLTQKIQRWTEDQRYPEVIAAEKREVRSILAQAQKRSFYDTWISEEEDETIRFGPKSFWMSLREPEQGEWSSALNQGYDQNNPFIDPEQVDLEELPEPTFGKPAIDLWQTRRNALEDQRAALRSTYYQRGFDAMLGDIYGQPPQGSDWTEYFKQHADAKELYLDGPEALRTLKTVRAKATAAPSAPDTPPPPSTEALEDIFALLTTAWKRKDKYADWFREEKRDKVVATYWKARKARLPRWRASRAGRQQWQEALRRRSQRPIIDPDQLAAGENLANPAPGERAYDLWKARQETLAQDLKNLEQIQANSGLVNQVNSITDPNNIPNQQLAVYPVEALLDQADSQALDKLKSYLSEDITRLHSLIEHAVGVSLKTLVNLAEQEQEGSSIEARLAQLTLTRPAFSFLLNVHERMANDISITGNTWQEVYNLLVAVMKRRRWADWQMEERPAFLFELDPKFRSDLKADNLSSDLRAAFQNQNVALSQNVTITTQEAGHRWRLQDDDNNSTYTIVAGEAALRVYLQHGTANLGSGNLPIFRYGAITLSSKQFRLADRQEVLDRFEAESPRAWRMSLAAMREWRDTLEARLEQRTQLEAALGEAVSQTEEETLGILRDALIEQLQQPSQNASFAEKAEWASERLLIDTEMSGCRQTTRVSQAIESLQTLLFALDAGQDIGDVSLTLTNADNFDEQWQRIGTYPRWKAAKTRYLYPENLLYPTFRAPETTTPPFQRLAETLRDRSLTPEAACRVASQYTTYLEDVTSLEVQASAWIELATGAGANACEGPPTGEVRPVFYMFGKGEASQQIYWSRFDAERGDWNEGQTWATEGKFQHSFWEPLKAEGLGPNPRIIGVQPYQDQLYLFLKTGDRTPGITLLRVNPQTGRVASRTELSVPEWAADFSAALIQRPGATGNPPPGLVITIPRDEGVVLFEGESLYFQENIPAYIHYENALDPSGQGWTYAQWKRLLVFGRSNLGDWRPEIAGAIELDTDLYIFTNTHGDQDPASGGTNLVLISAKSRSMEIAPKVLRNLDKIKEYRNLKELEERKEQDLRNLQQKLARLKRNIRGGEAQVRRLIGDLNALLSRVARQANEPFDPINANTVIKVIKNTSKKIDELTDLISHAAAAALQTGLSLLPDTLIKRTLGMSARNFIRTLINVADQLREDYQALPGVWKQVEVAKHDLDNLQTKINELAGKKLVDRYQEWRDGVTMVDGLLLGPTLAVTYYHPQTPSVNVFGLHLIYKRGKSGSGATVAIFKAPGGQHQESLRQMFEDGSAGSKTRNYDYPAVRDTQVRSVAACYNPNEGGRHKFIVYNAETWNYYSGPILQTAAGNLPLDTTQSWVVAPQVPTPPPGEKPKVSWLDIADGVFPVGAQFRDEPERNWLNGVLLFNDRSPFYVTFFLRSNLIYLWEAYYFLPMQIGLRLCQAGQYEAGLDWFRRVYDYTLPPDKRKIFPRLKWEEQYEKISSSTKGWGRRALNPHVVAASRQNAYTQFTLFSIIRGLLNYADEEFTQDTGESIQRARTLYETALDLLEMKALNQLQHPCEKLTVEIRKKIQEKVEGDDGFYLDGIGESLRRAIDGMNDVEKLKNLNTQLDALVLEGQSPDERIKRVQETINQVQGRQTRPAGLRESLEAHTKAKQAAFRSLLAYDSVARSTTTAATAAMASREEEADGAFYTDILPTISLTFCLPANPVLQSLRQRAELNLEKIRTCRNFAGMERELEPYAAPIGLERTASGPGGDGAVRRTNIRPTDYRYDTLIARTKELVNLAQKIESSFLSALMRRDEEAYKLLQARQDMGLAEAGVRLQTLRVRESEQRVARAELQREQAHIRADTYERWQQRGMNSYEKQMIEAYRQAADKAQAAADWSVASSAVQGAVSGAGLVAASGPVGLAALGGMAVSGGLAFGQSRARRQAIEARSRAQAASVKASHARRMQRWRLQERVAEQNRRIAAQQIRIAQAHVNVVEQQREISELKVQHAQQTLEFLQEEQFTTYELFDWMADVLEDVYRYFLQQAASMARLAQRQLAFERQETPPQFIQTGYWHAPRHGQSRISSNAETPDRRGLTGSARLLRDIYQLDQYAFRTDERKLHVSKTISLAQLTPFELQQFRETGVLTFDTPEELFRRDYPGQYLRLIKNVSVSVIALTPPNEGIKATLSNGGISRVVTGGPPFRTRVIRREPESIALSSPRNETGVFQLQPEGEMLLPFEKTGVDTNWELRMPRAANPFDYDTIADVLLTINYTALDSPTYRQQVIKRLDPEESGERAFSFSDVFADQWYDLHNPEQTDTPMTVRFETRRGDFPPNMEDVDIENVLLFFVTEDGVDTRELKTTLSFTPHEGQGTVGGEAVPIDQVISTRRGNGASWLPIIGKSVEGQWELSLPNTAQVKRLFQEEKIEDILFVVTYEGRTPEWPA